MHANVMQLKVLDHIIIGNNCYFSFADEGLLDEYDIMFQDFKRRDQEGSKFVKSTSKSKPKKRRSECLVI